MMNPRFLIPAVFVAATLLFSGCATKPYDYTNLRAHPPRSVVVLPPLNESTAVEATYSYLSTVTWPLAEKGYYVFPVAVVDQFLKENGLPTAGEMHQVPLEKFSEIIGADAVLYLIIKQYGSKYQVLNSATIVHVSARLVDTKTELLLWEGEAIAQENSSSGNLIGDLISAALTQAINSSTDAAHPLCRDANTALFQPKGKGLLYGPLHPQFGTD